MTLLLPLTKQGGACSDSESPTAILAFTADLRANNTVVVLIGATGLWLATGAKTTFFPAGASWTFYLGGVFGFIIIAAAVLVFPRLGAAYAIALMVCGQCLAAMVIDHYGLLGMERSPATLQRVLGVLLVVAGVAVFRLGSSAVSTP